MTRGNKGTHGCGDDRHRKLSLETLGELCGQTGWRIHGYA
jgi:hypothetical protein